MPVDEETNQPSHDEHQAHHQDEAEESLSQGAAPRQEAGQHYRHHQQNGPAYKANRVEHSNKLGC